MSKDFPHLTSDSKERKATPIARGVLDYFPLAVAAVARVSMKGNEKHNPGEPMHWSREKSTDHADCVARHLIERGTVEKECGELHEACLAWRALALLELAEEARLGRTTVVNQAPPKIEVAWAAPPSKLPFTPSKEQQERETRAALASLDRANAPKFTFWYLATPYSKYINGPSAAFNLATSLTAMLVRKRVPVFCPIAHTHHVATWLKPADRIDHDLWMRADAPMMEAASGLIVVTAESWENSKGMREEIKRFLAMGKPVIYWAPDCNIPSVVLESAT